MPKKPVPETPPEPAPETLPDAPVRFQVGGTEEGLPGGLHLNGSFWATRLPDGRVLPEGLPDAVLALYYPDLFPDTMPAPAQAQGEVPEPVSEPTADEAPSPTLHSEV